MFVLGNEQLEVEATWACRCGRTLCHPSFIVGIYSAAEAWDAGSSRWRCPLVAFPPSLPAAEGLVGLVPSPGHGGLGGVFMVSWRVFMVLPECGAWHLSALSGWVLSRAGLLPWVLGVGD